MKFVDLNNGGLFDVDENYVFWIDGKQSTVIQYANKICVYSASQYIQIDYTDTISKRVDPSITYSTETISDIDYINIDDMVCTSNISTGKSYSTGYVHMIYFIMCSEDAGEYTDTVTITEGTTTYTFQIGGVFDDKYDPYETLLTNEGVEFPSSIQKAIYQTNLHEYYSDNVVLNRKYKELLQNYSTIIMQKGNYKSLQNALSWFEYGDLVEIKEFWSTQSDPYFHYSTYELNTIRDSIKTLLDYSNKSTYYGLYAALNEVSTDTNGDVKYENTSITLTDAVEGMEDVVLYPVYSDKAMYEDESWNRELIINDDGSASIEDWDEEGGKVPWDQVVSIDAATFNEVSTSTIDVDGVELEYIHTNYPDPDTEEDYFINFTAPESVDDEELVEIEPIDDYDEDYSVNTYGVVGANFKNLTMEWDGEVQFLSEPIPMISNVIHEISREDLFLKMTLLGKYFSKYFLPIHVDLVHSTAENIVFANTMKISAGVNYTRIDSSTNINTLTCSLSDSDRWYLGNVKGRVNPGTFFRPTAEEVNESSWNMYGVDVEEVSGVWCGSSDEFSNTLGEDYAWNMYDSIGCVIPVSVEFDNDSDVYISNMIITNNDDLEDYVNIKDYTIIEAVEGKVQKDFNILFKNPGIYTISMSFTTLSGQQFMSTDEVYIESTIQDELVFEKIIRKSTPTKCLDVSSFDLDGYMFNNTNSTTDDYTTQYIVNGNISNGVGLNEVVIIRLPDDYSEYITAFEDGYTVTNYFKNTVFSGGSITFSNLFETYVSERYTDDEVFTLDDSSVDMSKAFYVMVVSRYFTDDDSWVSLVDNYIGGSEMAYMSYKYMFIPSNHSITTTPDFITKEDVLMVSNTLRNTTEVSDVVWEFINDSTGQTYSTNLAIRTPFVAPFNEYIPLESGYYSVKCRYNTKGSTQEIDVSSKFVITK